MVILVDVGLVLVVLLSLIAGMRSGFVETLFSLAAWIGGIVIAIHVSRPLLDLMPESVQEIPGAIYVLGVLVFLVAFALINLVGMLAGHRKERATQAGDRILGGILGLARGIFLSAAIASLLVAFLPRDGEITRRSGTFRLLSPAGHVVAGLAPQWLRERMDEGWAEVRGDEEVATVRAVHALLPTAAPARGGDTTAIGRGC
jgi:membrane protein required for colicin V production